MVNTALKITYINQFYKSTFELYVPVFYFKNTFLLLWLYLFSYRPRGSVIAQSISWACGNLNTKPKRKGIPQTN